MKKISVLFALLFLSFAYSQNKFDSASVTSFQEELNKEFANAKTSPLLAADLKDFESLDFFPVNEKYFVNAKFTRTPKEKAFKMKTSTDRTPIYVKYGEVDFLLNGRSYKLNVYRDIALSRKKEFKDYLFLPFSDLTSGAESYIGGRYIDLKLPKGDTLDIDFNKAYNPYCAYSPEYSCPRVPLENDLDAEIKAGVKKFHD
ncbi:DUF1684 domain-containing protein [Flavobacterium frigidarium]|uniref:DUF1684 domain-containing protein n=1 Tax=Flavobacterium frigidarium TaxID=99286 RepID=UPI0030D6D6BC